MGRPYEGSLAQWVDQHGGANATVEQLVEYAKAEGKPYDYRQLRRARWVSHSSRAGEHRQKVLATVAKHGRQQTIPGTVVSADVLGLPVKRKPGRPPRMPALPAPDPVRFEHDEGHPEDEGPPPKHTAFRKMVLEIGLDTARQILSEFHDISERIR